jgi:hypothetical protein
MESFKDRLGRYTVQDDLEIFGWMTVMMQNYPLRELRIASEKGLYQCVFLCSHAIIQTISEGMFDKRGIDGTRFYLENFVDEPAKDKKFSLITEEIHEMRNVIAHQGYSSLQHNVDFNDEMTEGWKEESNIVYINTKIYAEQFTKAFESAAQVLLYLKLLSVEERIKRKYFFIRKWLRLEKTNKIAQAIKKLADSATLQDIRIQEQVVQQMIFQEYSLI